MMGNFAESFSVNKKEKKSVKSFSDWMKTSRKKSKQRRKQTLQIYVKEQREQGEEEALEGHQQQGQQHLGPNQSSQPPLLPQGEEEEQQNESDSIPMADGTDYSGGGQDEYNSSEDEVFIDDDDCYSPTIESRDAASDDEHNNGDGSGLVGCFRGSKKQSKTLPAIVVESETKDFQARGSSQVRLRSNFKSNYMKNGHHASVSATTVKYHQGPSEITFNESTLSPNEGIRFCNFRRPQKAQFTVKYTKVYGEADGAYRNDSTPRGLVFVANFSKFKNDVYTERLGSSKDFDNMITLFQQMGYDPFHRRRRYCMSGYITKKCFMDKLGAFASEIKHKVLCSCAVILMSHGKGPKTFVTSDNQEVDLLDVYQIFDNINCTFLHGKPKIFILQFCRSIETTSCRESTLSQHQLNLMEEMVKQQVSKIVQRYLRRCSFKTFAASGGGDGDKSNLFVQIEEHSRQASLASLSSSIMEQEQREEEEALSTSTPLGKYHADTARIPAMPQVGFQRYSDMYSIFSTSPGELSQRDPEKGSLLIQAICHIFAEYAYQDDIDNLVRRVSKYMTNTLQKDDPITLPRQTCERTNNGLDKLFYFNPYELVQNRQFTI